MDDTAYERGKRAERLHILEGLLQVSGDPHRFLDAMQTAAETALQQHFGLSRDQATAAVNLQFRNMTETSRRLLREEADRLRD